MAKKTVSPELYLGIAILILSMSIRVWFSFLFPAQPVSDFRAIVDFAVEFSKDIFSGYYAWRSISPGLPVILSLLINIFSQIPPEAIGRWATVMITGFTPIIPYLAWKGIFPYRVRVFAGFLLALWPGQVLFSTVVAQDNWVILPIVTICTLAMRIIKNEEHGWPLAGSSLFALAIFIRQEMLIVLLPVVMVVIIGSQPRTRMKNLFWGGIVLTALLFLMILHRGISTGKYALSSTHLGRSMLGSYAPGAGKGWVDPGAYLAATDPALLNILDTDFASAQDRMVDIAIDEFFRRPKFHTARIITATVYALFDGDVDNLYWSLTAPNVLTEENLEKAEILKRHYLRYGNNLAILTHSLFIFSILLLIQDKKKALLIAPVLLTILFKIAIHALIVITPRYFLAVAAMEFLVVAVSLDGIIYKHNRNSVIRSALVGTAIVLFVYFYPYKQISSYVLANDETETQFAYRFPLRVPGPQYDIEINCYVTDGWLELKGLNEASLKFIHNRPRTNENATANCSILTTEPVTLTMSIYDPISFGDLPGAFYQIVYINEKEVINHDVSDNSWGGWIDTPVQVIESANITFELLAIAPKSGMDWSRDMVPLKFRFSIIP